MFIDIVDFFIYDGYMDIKPKRYFTDEEIVEMMIAASKWGSHAYKMESRRLNNTLNLWDFTRHRRETMEDILKKSR